MTAKLTYPPDGRGAWPTRGTGGTLSLDGMKPGRYYRAVGKGSGLYTIGLIGYRAERDNGQVSIDDYATFCAVRAVQQELAERGLMASAVDGLWGPNTDSAVKAFQVKTGLTADGVFGPQTARSLFDAKVRQACVSADGVAPAVLYEIATGTISWESGWDPGAVGADPQDLGLCQINGPSHPILNPAMRLDPAVSISYMTGLILKNLKAMGYVLADAVAAYNLGTAGAKAWVAAGRPDVFKGRDVRKYINKILGTT